MKKEGQKKRSLRYWGCSYFLAAQVAPHAVLAGLGVHLKSPLSEYQERGGGRGGTFCGLFLLCIVGYFLLLLQETHSPLARSCSSCTPWRPWRGSRWRRPAPTWVGGSPAPRRKCCRHRRRLPSTQLAFKESCKPLKKCRYRIRKPRDFFSSLTSGCGSFLTAALAFLLNLSRNTSSATTVTVRSGSTRKRSWGSFLAVKSFMT